MRKQTKRVNCNREVFSQNLEVKSYGDDAWYNATLEILNNRVHVRFEGFDEYEDEIWDVNYLRKYVGNISAVIRVTSPQLQDQDCALVVEDMIVCARHIHDSDRSDEDQVEEVKYFDAKITKVDRNPHSFLHGEERCNCVFEGYWMAGPDKKKRKYFSNVLLSCEDICLLSPSNVETHPVVKKILRLAVDGIRGPPTERPTVRKLSRFENSRAKTSGTKRTLEHHECSPMFFYETQEDDSHCEVINFMESREASSRDENRVLSSSVEDIGGSSNDEDREGSGRETHQKTPKCDVRHTAVETESCDDSGYAETVDSEDLSSATSSSAVKKRSRSEKPKQKDKNVLSPGQKVKKHSVGACTKPLLKRMRGSVTNLVSPPAWFNPAGCS